MKKGYLRNVVNESYTTGTGKGLPWKTNPAARFIKIDLRSTYAEEIDKEEAMKWTRGISPIRGTGGLLTYQGEEYLVLISGNR
jgi:hypothetical protein